MPRPTKLRIMNTSARRAHNSRRMSSSVFKDLNPIGMSTYKENITGRATRWQLVSVAAAFRRAPVSGSYAHRSKQRAWTAFDSQLLTIDLAYLTQAECALTRKGEGGHRRERHGHQERRGVKKVQE